MNITQLRHEAEKHEIHATEKRRVAENFEIQSHQYADDDPGRADTSMADALRYRAEADSHEQQAKAMHAEMQKLEEKLEQMKKERLHLQAEYEEKISHLDAEMVNIGGVLF